MAEFYKIKQKSGLTILFEKRDLPIVSIMAATRAGAVNENLRNKGIAHFFEHMVFKGTKTRNVKEIGSSIEKVGGMLNGFTSEQITAFYCKLPSRHFDVGADVILDIVANPKLITKDINKERGIIISEINYRKDMPKEYLFNKIKELLYQKPFSAPVIGFKETVSKFKRIDFLRWHKNYNPKNMIISIVGNANLKDIDKFTKKYFNKTQPYVLPSFKIKKVFKNNEIIESKQGLDQTHFTLGFHTPVFSSKMRYASEIFNAILGEGFSSVLFQEVREKRGWAYAIHSYLEQEKDYGYGVVYAGIDKKNIKKVKQITIKEIKNMSKIKAIDFEQTKEQKVGNWKLGLESCDNVAGNLVFQEIATKAEDFYDYPEKIYNVKLQDVRKLAKIKNYATAILVPK